MPGDDTNSRTPKLRRCSFCGKTSDQVRRMVAGPNAQICNECILLCQEIINDDFSAVHDEDFVGAFHRRDALRNDDFRGIGNFFRKRLSDQSIRLGIDRRSRIVENEHFGFSQKGAGDTEPLLLTAGYVGSSLFDIRIVAVGERANEFICLS